MPLSTFSDKTKPPNKPDLAVGLGKTFAHWNEIKSFIARQHPGATEEWKYPGAKYGWSFRLRDKKRVIVYMTPGDGYFTIALVFGEQATNEALKSTIPASIKAIIESAPVYAEGKGFRIEVKPGTNVKHIKKLLSIKIAH